MPLQAFADEEMIQSTQDVPMATIYPCTPIIDIRKINRYDFVNKTGNQKLIIILHSM